MHEFYKSFKRNMIECEINRNGIKINNVLGLVSDSKEYNCISFDPEVDVQINDDIYCPIKKKHYIIINTDIKTLQGKPHRLEAYFENNFTRPSETTIFNTYNPNNSIIGNQQNAVININDCFNNLDNLINQNGNEDIDRLNELSSILKEETKNQKFDKSKLSKFGDLITKYSWVAASITQIIAAWIQR